MSVPADQLAAFVGAARWFGGKGRAFEIASVSRLAEVPRSGSGPLAVIELVEVRFADSGQQTDLYQVPLALYDAAQPRLAHAEVGSWTEPDGREWHAYDAVHDRDAMAMWLAGFAAAGPEGVGPEGVGPEGAGPHGDLIFRRVPGHRLDLGVHSTLLSAEQSNSSVAFGEDSLFKVFRRVRPGVNPDIELHERLTVSGSDHVAALYGWLEHPASGLQLGILQQFLRTAADGWDLAQASVRNLFAEADLHAGEVGGDFAGEAARLGVAVAQVHQVLRESLGAGTVDASWVAGQMRARLADAVVAVPALAEHVPALHACYDRLAELGELEVQRVHGDLHLGQTLRTVKGWKVVDFEGEPAKPLAERQLPDNRWRDVAGMLRSFDYAAGVVRRTLGAEAPASVEQLRFRGAEWVDRNRAAFIAAYAGGELTSDQRDIVMAYVADKAVYEAVYEARNRPAWVSIPLEALADWRTA